jgi:precorrin-4 C11-methyltransferase
VHFATSPAQAREAEAVIRVTDRAREAEPALPQTDLLYARPPSLIVGVGCERGAPAEALERGLERFLAEHGYARAAVAGIASHEVKAEDAGVAALAERLEAPLHLYDAETLAATAGTESASAVVERAVGTPAVAEPAALRAAETDRLLAPKAVHTDAEAPQRMTFALARRAGYAPPQAGVVTFLGAGPGDPQLLTLKGRAALQEADRVVYAGSLVPEGVLGHAPAGAAVHNSASMTLEQVLALLVSAARAGERVVRLHSGDLTLYSAMGEQMRLLEEEQIPIDVIPGISAFQAAAATLPAELTVPERVQTVILTRAEGQTPMPEGEALEELAAHGAVLCVFLSARMIERVQEKLLTGYGPETPVSVHYRTSWPDELNFETRLGSLAEQVRAHNITRTTLVMVGEALSPHEERSNLYHAGHGHIFRARKRT